MVLSNNKIVAFPSPASHKLEAGGTCPMEIKHTHPKSKSPDERAAQLKDIAYGLDQSVKKIKL